MASKIVSRILEIVLILFRFFTTKLCVKNSKILMLFNGFLKKDLHFRMLYENETKLMLKKA